MIDMVLNDNLIGKEDMISMMIGIMRVRRDHVTDVEGLWGR